MNIVTFDTRTEIGKESGIVSMRIPITATANDCPAQEEMVRMATMRPVTLNLVSMNANNAPQVEA